MPQNTQHFIIDDDSQDLIAIDGREKYAIGFVQSIGASLDDNDNGSRY